MAELPDGSMGDYRRFAARWMAEIVAVFLRAIREPALAYDLATETMAAARLRWSSAPADCERVAWLLELGADVLAATVQCGRVPSTERRRQQQPPRNMLTVVQQQELMALTEARLELPAAAQGVADALARTAPPMHVLRELRRSDLVDAEALPDGARECHDR